MRVELDTGLVTVAPGGAAEVTVEVFNSTGAIDGITTRVIGLDPAWVRARPAQLALFPDTSGKISLHLDIPPEFPAGTHQLSIEVASSVDPSDLTYVSLGLEVQPLTDVILRLEPRSASAHRRARYEVVADNAGNTPVDLALTGSDNERSLDFVFTPPVLDVAPGSTAVAVAAVRCRRRWFGSPLSRSLTVTGSSRQTELTAAGTFEQLPLIPRGVMTIALLGAVVAAWAVVFLLGLGAVMAGDEYAKMAPASMFATSAEVLAAGGGPGGTGAGGAKVDARAVGGSVEGTVTAASTTQGVGRITIEAIRLTRDGPVLVSAAATEDDGTYSLSGLPPGRYNLRFAAPGFRESWYPGVPSQSGAEEVRIGASSETTGLDVVIEGLPGSVAGVVDTGLSPGRVPAAVTVRPLLDGVPGPIVATTSTDGAGAFAVVSLETPGIYELAVSAPGYQPTIVVENLGGGEQLLTNTVRLSAGDGAITGLVSDGSNPLGGVTIVASSGDLEITSATPTTGAVGQYSLPNLPTPGTYLLTFSREGFGAETIAVDLGPGEQRSSLNLVLTGGTGSISGRVTNTSDVPLGDVVVTVNGGTTSITTRTLTGGGAGSGGQGTYVVTGLPTPGSYTLTFTHAGHASETISVNLGDDGFARNINVSLAPTLAALRGNVSSAAPGGGGLAAVVITITDGANVRTTTSATLPTLGAYALTALPPGSYAVTFEASGYHPLTLLITLAAGENAVRNVALNPS